MQRTLHPREVGDWAAGRVLGDVREWGAIGFPAAGQIQEGDLCFEAPGGAEQWLPALFAAAPNELDRGVHERFRWPRLKEGVTTTPS